MAGMGLAQRLAAGLLWGSSAALVLLAFVWPLAVSRDPADPAFRIVAIASLASFFVSLAAVLALRLAALRSP